MQKLVVTFAVGLLLSACQGDGIGRAGSPAWFATSSQESIVSHYKSQCASYGYTDGTPQMSSCIQQEVANGRALASQRAQNSFNTMATVGAINAAQQQTYQPVRCNTVYSGNVASTQCF